MCKIRVKIERNEMNEVSEMSKILIVDDEKMITQTLSTLIEMMLDVEVVTYNDPSEIINSEILKNEKFDMVISDFMMPKLNGIELLGLIKEIQPEIVPILLTGYSDKENAIKSINEVGLYYYLEKPWDNHEIIKVIENGMEKKKLKDDVKEKVIIIEKRNSEITRLYDLLKRDFNQEIGNMVDVVITLANLIEAKDSYTDGHTRRVADVCAAIGNKMNMDHESVKYLEISAMIHDIGKVGTPEAILNKPGALEDHEFFIIKNHPEIGARILRPLTALEPCVDAILHHHEKLDGSGYPDGLKGDQIPLQTRIVAVADIFDALYSDRPYRGKMPLDKVMEIIQKDTDRGKLDSIVVRTLNDLIEDGTIEELYKD
jgi:putative two-component system response regulator